MISTTAKHYSCGARARRESTASGSPGSSVFLSSPGIGVGHGISALSAYRGQRFVQGLEDMVGADDVAQAVAVQIGPQRRFRVNEHQRYAEAD